MTCWPQNHCTFPYASTNYWNIQNIRAHTVLYCLSWSIFKEAKMAYGSENVSDFWLMSGFNPSCVSKYTADIRTLLQGCTCSGVFLTSKYKQSGNQYNTMPARMWQINRTFLFRLDILLPDHTIKTIFLLLMFFKGFTKWKKKNGLFITCNDHLDLAHCLQEGTICLSSLCTLFVWVYCGQN